MLALLMLSWPARAGDDLHFDLQGYYRARAYTFHGLFEDAPSPTSRYLTQRLRLEPVVDYRGLAKFTLLADALDDVVWGDNESLADTALFADQPSDTTIEGAPGSNFQVKRAWAEFTLPVGLMRVGRQPSDWGMGLLSNDGDGFDDLFGENHGGSTYDRILFATRPWAIVQAARGQEDSGFPLYAVVAIDHLVEDPLVQYYGYQCDAGSATDDPACTDTEDHDYTEPRTDDQRSGDWWADNADDVYEMVYVLTYKGEDLQWGSDAADFSAGAYVVNRVQRESSSNIWIYDAYTRLAWRSLLLEAEALTFRGHSEDIALPGATNLDPGANPLYKEARIWTTAGRLGLQHPGWSAIAEAGFAEGDEKPADELLTGYPIHPDFNVGLLLYDEVLSRVTASTWTDAAEGLWSHGGVYSSTYLFPNASLRPFDWLELDAAFLVAWPSHPDGARILTDADSSASTLGHEADLALKLRFDEVMNFSMEGGYLWLTDRIPYQNLGLTPDGRVWTMQSRIAYEF